MARTKKPSDLQAEPISTGRPPTRISPEDLEKLAFLQCTYEEAAAFFGCSERTIKRRFQKNPELKASWKKGQLTGHTSLRRLMWRHAHMPNSAGANMSIFLAKNWLGMTDKQALTDKDGNDLVVTVKGGLPDGPPPDPAPAAAVAAAVIEASQSK